MPVLKLDCSTSAHPTFESKDISLSRVNFFYGKNGTGKTSLANMLYEQFMDSYQVKRFDGFKGLVAGNDELNAITMGEINTSAQNKINELNPKIAEIVSQLSVDSEIENLYSKRDRAQKNYTTAGNKLTHFYTEQAAKIKRTSNPTISIPTYNINNFKQDRSNALRLSDSDIEAAKSECLSEQLTEPVKITYPTPNLQELTQSVNTLVTTSITATAELRGIGDDPAKRRFAEQGMKCHDRQHDSYCAFCGGPLTDDRWRELDRLFSKATADFKNDLGQEYDAINNAISELKSVVSIDSSTYYSPYRQQITDLNLSVSENVSAAISYLEFLLSQLKQKKDDVFATLEKITKQIPTITLAENQSAFDALHAENIAYGNALEEKQRRAKEKLRLSMVAELLDSAKYDSHSHQELCDAITQAKALLDTADSDYNEAEKQLSILKRKKDEIRKSTVDTSLAAENITKLLQSIGMTSFELRLLDDGDGTSSGQYRIISDGEERKISSLSTGEMNLVAFLYFMQQLTAISAEKPVLTIIDDPMNSNDETSQYLMYSCIQHYYGLQKRSPSIMKDDDILVVLTHNTHFFLNCRPYGWTPNDGRVACFTLYKHNNSTQLQKITRPEEDIQTGYTSLWHELHHAYEANEPGLMWNPLRRILTTYAKFNGAKGIEELITQNSDDPVRYDIVSELKKGMDVNSHELYDFEINPNDYDREQIIEVAQWYFETLDDVNHFDHYWNEELKEAAASK